jgi:hypothetical protein
LSQQLLLLLISSLSLSLFTHLKHCSQFFVAVSSLSKIRVCLLGGSLENGFLGIQSLLELLTEHSHLSDLLFSHQEVESLE